MVDPCARCGLDRAFEAAVGDQSGQCWREDCQPALLPEVLTVENPTPQLDAPFSLTGRPAPDRRGHQPDLFKE